MPSSLRSRLAEAMRRLVVVVLAGVVFSGLGTGVASAHANGQPIPDAAHYLTVITSVTPAVSGLTVTVDPRGEWIQVRNSTSKTLTVLGYVREPYLRIDAAGVAQNDYSPTLQLNQSLFGDLSQLGDSSLPASWTHTSDGREVRWHDHRIHWMTADRPAVVKKSPSQPHLIGHWTVHLTLDTQPVTVAGTLSWLPVKPRISRFMTYFVAADSVLFVAAVGVIAYLIRRRGRRKQSHSVGAPPPSFDELDRQRSSTRLVTSHRSSTTTTKSSDSGR